MAQRQRTHALLALLALLGLLLSSVAVAQKQVTAHMELPPPDFMRENEESLPETHWLSDDRTHVCTSGAPSSAAVGSGEGAECYPRVFVPTDEFRPIRPGQMIPHGIHLKMDMQTGEKQARRATDDIGTDDTSDGSGDIAATGLRVVEKRPATEAADPVESESTVTPLTPERKAELDALWDHLMAMARRETEQLLEALRTLRDPAAPAEAVTGALDVMEDIVHHIDYARDLVAMDGVEPIVNLLTHASDAVRAQAASVLGAALQRYSGLDRGRHGCGRERMHLTAPTHPPPGSLLASGLPSLATRTSSPLRLNASTLPSVWWSTWPRRPAQPTSSDSSSPSAPSCAATAPPRATLSTARA